MIEGRRCFALAHTPTPLLISLSPSTRAAASLAAKLIAKVLAPRLPSYHAPNLPPALPHLAFTALMMLILAAMTAQSNTMIAAMLLLRMRAYADNFEGEAVAMKRRRDDYLVAAFSMPRYEMSMAMMPLCSDCRLR